MNYQLIYDITQEEYQIGTGSIIMAFIIVVLVGGAIGIGHDRYKKGELRGVLSSLAFIVFVLYFFLTPLINFNQIMSKDNIHLIKIAKSQVYKKVEGKVKNFQRMSVDRKKPERFEVDGVEFHYNTAMLTGAFNQPNSPIKDGLLVRISYIYDKNWDMNLILKLEVAE